MQRLRLELKAKEQERIEINGKIEFYRELASDIHSRFDNLRKGFDKVKSKISSIQMQRDELSS